MDELANLVAEGDSDDDDDDQQQKPEDLFLDDDENLDQKLLEI